MTKYHRNNEGLWLPCKAEKGKCPFGTDADKTVQQIVTEAVVKQRTGEQLPVLKDNAGNVRSFNFDKDGSYTFGARTYDRHGVLVPSDRTVKKYRLQEVHVADEKPDWAKLTADLKMQFIGPDLILHETTNGQLAQGSKEAGLKFADYRAYTRVHHRGLFGWFFTSEWKQTPKDDSLADRYRLTLEGMFGKVKAWVGRRGRRAA